MVSGLRFRCVRGVEHFSRRLIFSLSSLRRLWVFHSAGRVAVGLQLQTIRAYGDSAIPDLYLAGESSLYSGPTRLIKVLRVVLLVANYQCY